MRAATKAPVIVRRAELRPPTSGARLPDADVVQPAVDPQGELAVGVDAVGADAVVAVGGPVAGETWG
ncbi:MAG TPA: hypothetical protein VEV61_18875 [Streptosporangiaceae bacterium]|nr:hypothetical protein [Streptosporangiaceae bacterium]